MSKRIRTSYLTKYRLVHLSTIKAQQHKWYLLHKVKLAIKAHRYYITHKADRREKNSMYALRRYHTNINYRLAQLLRRRLRHAIKENIKYINSKLLLGCSIDYLKKYLENKFKPGMSWNNHGKWHIDHIKPCASFDLSKPEEQRKCFHYTNLQPLWAKDNLIKGSRTARR